jgi:hypothetical protein
VSEDRKVLRKRYLETILPPFAALLRRWRPLLSGIHELTDSQGQSPLAVEDRPLATDALPLEVKVFCEILVGGSLLDRLNLNYFTCRIGASFCLSSILLGAQ